MTHDANGVKQNGDSGTPPVVHQIVITLDEARGRLDVTGVPPSKVTAFGMLKLAEAIIAGQGKAPPQQSSIVAVPPGTRLR